MKDSIQNHMDNFFRNMLQFHKKEPGSHVWDNIEKELDREDETALADKKKLELKRVGIVLLSFFFLCSMLLYYRLNSFQPAGSNISESILKRGTGKLLLKPIQTLPTTPISISANSFVNRNAGQKFKIELPDPDFHLSWTPHSTEALITDFIPATTANQVLHLVESPENRPLQIQPFADQHIIKLPRPKFRDRFSITPYFSQEFAGYNFTDNDVTAPNGKEIEKAERNIFSASVGMYFNYRINNRWMLQSGISYSWSRSIMDSSQSYAVMNASGEIAFKLNTASGFSFLHSPSFIVPMVGDSMATAKTHSELHYVTVPLVLSYRMPMHRFTLLAGAGMTFNVLTHAALETDIYGANYKQNESEIPIRGLKKINFGLLVKAEIQYRVTSKMAVSLMPSFKNTLGPINLGNSSLAAYPYNFGIGAGIVYLF